MNDLEFQTQYKRLKDIHPQMFANQTRMQIVWDNVNDLDVLWFEKLVDRLVSAHDIYDDKYNIRDAAIGERRARRSAQFAENVILLSDIAHGRATEKGLDKVLEKYGASSLFEAVEKSRKGELG